MLVGASMAIFHDPVSGTQFFGYSIALSGLVYYKLGAEKLKEVAGDASRQWADYGNRSPIMRKLVSFAIVLIVFFLLLGGVGNLFPQYDASDYAMKKLGGMMGNSGA